MVVELEDTEMNYVLLGKIMHSAEIKKEMYYALC